MNLKYINNWKFATELNNYLTNIEHNMKDNEIDNIVNNIQDGVKNIYDKCFYKCNRIKNPIWWDSSLDIERKRVRALRRKYQCTLDMNFREKLLKDYKLARAKHKKIILKKKDSFRNYIANITTSNMFGYAYKIVKDRSKVNRINYGIRRDNNSLTESFDEGRRLILEYNFRYIMMDDYIFLNSNTNDECNKEFQNGEVDKVLRGVKNVERSKISTGQKCLEVTFYQKITNQKKVIEKE